MKLTKPIKAHGEELADLTFREPTGNDLISCGFPFKMELSAGRSVRVVDTQAVAAYISALAGVPPSSVAQLSVIDFTRAMGEVMGFFGDSPSPTPS